MHHSTKAEILSCHQLCSSVANICIVYLSWEISAKEQDLRAAHMGPDGRRWEVELRLQLIPSGFSLEAALVMKNLLQLWLPVGNRNPKEREKVR